MSRPLRLLAGQEAARKRREAEAKLDMVDELEDVSVIKPKKAARSAIQKKQSEPVVS